MKDNEKKGGKGSTANKVKKLKDQYNKILVDLFDQYAAECIEGAIGGTEGSFGENIIGIVETALDNLKGKVLGELGISGGEGVEIGGIAVMGLGEPDGDEFGGEAEYDHEEPDGDEPKSFELEYEKGDEGEEEKVEEKAPPGAKNERMVKHIKKSAKKAGKSDEEAKKIAYATAWKHHNQANESAQHDSVLAKSRRNDQQLLSEAYTNMIQKSEH